MEFDLAAPGFERIVARDTPLEVIAHDVLFGEGPVWNKASGELFYTDIIGDTIWKWAPGAGNTVVMRPSLKANGMTLDAEGRLVVAGWASRSVWRMARDGSIETLATHYQGKKLNTPNDIVVKSDQSIWFTDPTGALNNMEMHGEDVQRYLDFNGVYRIDCDGGLRLMIEDCVYPNGLAFSPDESVLYVNDTRQALIRAFDVRADGSVGPPRLFYRLAGTEPGVADGMKVDVEGNVYCTGPAGVHVIAPSGQLLGRIKLPGHCTNMAWGDDDWRTMYVTTFTSRVFRFRLGISGIPLQPGILVI
jgi:gluconolactonase